jgi:hypothetical protein
MGRTPENLSGGSHARSVEKLGDAEVGELYGHSICRGTWALAWVDGGGQRAMLDENVLGLDVSVNNATCVRVRQSLENF